VGTPAERSSSRGSACRCGSDPPCPCRHRHHRTHSFISLRTLSLGGSTIRIEAGGAVGSDVTAAQPRQRPSPPPQLMQHTAHQGTTAQTRNRAENRQRGRGVHSAHTSSTHPIVPTCTRVGSLRGARAVRGVRVLGVCMSACGSAGMGMGMGMGMFYRRTRHRPTARPPSHSTGRAPTSLAGPRRGWRPAALDPVA
jgi:hypothetical protein